MYINEYSNPFSVKNIIKDTKEARERHRRKTSMNDQDEKQKYEYEKMRNEMKENMKNNNIDIDNFTDNFLTMFGIMNDIVNNIDTDFDKKKNNCIHFTETEDSNRYYKQEYLKYKKMFRNASELAEKQRKQIENLLKEKENFAKEVERKKKSYAEALNALSLQIKEMSEKSDNKNSLQEEVFNKERAELIQENCKLKNKVSKLQEEYDTLKNKHVDLVHAINQLTKDNREF